MIRSFIPLRLCGIVRDDVSQTGAAEEPPDAAAIPEPAGDTRALLVYIALRELAHKVLPVPVRLVLQVESLLESVGTQNLVVHYERRRAAVSQILDKTWEYDGRTGELGEHG